MPPECDTPAKLRVMLEKVGQEIPDMGEGWTDEDGNPVSGEDMGIGLAIIAYAESRGLLPPDPNNDPDPEGTASKVCAALVAEAAASDRGAGVDPNGTTKAGVLGSPGARAVAGVISTVSMAASAYHGYKRNDSVGWAIGWGLLGALFPIITPTIAVAQGFGKRKGRS